jgi:hypothetical protein
MKCLKEPLAPLANQQDKTRGFFFEGQFKSVAILDEESLLAVCAYIDLNPVAAGIAIVPEASEHTSFKERVERVEAQGRTHDLKEAQKGRLLGRFSPSASLRLRGQPSMAARGHRAIGSAPGGEPRRLPGHLRVARKPHTSTVFLNLLNDSLR